MKFFLLLGAVLTLPLGLCLLLRASPRPRFALSWTAMACGVLAALMGGWLMQDITPVQSRSAEGSATYFVLNQGAFLLNIGLAYLAIAAGLAVIAGMGNGLPQRMTPPVFAAFHLGTSLTLGLTLSPPWAMPRRYIDYPDHFQTLNLATTLASALSFLALATLGLLLLSAIGQRLLRKSV